MNDGEGVDAVSVSIHRRSTTQTWHLAAQTPLLRPTGF
jgi:hypothetical protein